MANELLDAVDLRFPLAGRSVPLDYADALWMAVRELAHWLEDDLLAGIHPIDGLSPTDGAWYLSGRTRLTLRVAPEQVIPLRAALEGRRLNIGGHEVVLGAAATRPIPRSSVLYAKFVAIEPARPDGRRVSEDAFLAFCRAEFDRLDIRPRMVCGMAQQARTPQGLLSGFSLMLSELEPDTVLRLQRVGLGVERKRGCGIFIPHKSGAAVGTPLE
jgi:CRISPR-associated protein Cas6